VRYQRAELPLKLDGVDTARAFDPQHETLWVAHLDAEARCLHLSRHSGDTCGVDFPLRNIVIDAAAHGTKAILLAHNHPSGDPRPSESDLRATRRLASVAEALDCRVLDHFVFAGADCSSFNALGYL